jgi:hypothetical protein
LVSNWSPDLDYAKGWSYFIEMLKISVGLSEDYAAW